MARTELMEESPMQRPELAQELAANEDVAAESVNVDVKNSRWEARQELDWHRAETERLRVLIDFLARPVHAHGGSEPDADIVTAYNLAVEAALQGIRRAATCRG